MSDPLSPAGAAAVAGLAQRYRVSESAVSTLLDAVIRGGGAMAQFSHPDLGGNGQWMRGGMTMVGDMFNPGLQATVSGICSELSTRLASGDALVAPSSSSGGTGAGTGAGIGAAEPFGSSSGVWWPSLLGRPSTSGGQNDDAYAYFRGARRLAIRRGPAVTLYDTGDHAISGVQQQQGGRGSLEFSSQLGTFTVDSLPIVQPDGPGVTAPTSAAPAPGAAAPEPTQAPPAAATQQPDRRHQATEQPDRRHRATEQPDRRHPTPKTPPPPAPAPPPPAASAGGAATTAAEIGAAIETLAGLRDKGFLTEAEFAGKKAELLARL